MRFRTAALLTAVAVLAAVGSAGGARSAKAGEKRFEDAAPNAVRYPASYFTGPLGKRNPVPRRKGVFLGSWLSLSGGAITWPQFKRHVHQREADMGRKYDFLMIADFENVWREQRLTWINKHGSIPVVANWTLNHSFTVPQIAAGNADAVIDRYADFWGSKNFVIMVRLMHEFDDPWAWGHSAVGQEQTWIDAWRRIVDRFKARGADNVGFWWCPNEGVRRDTIAKSYPGDGYVDWVGSSSYNWQYVGEDAWATPLHPGWGEFGELFDYSTDGNGAPLQSQHDTWGPRKPFVVGETGTVYDPNHPTKKPAWYRKIVPAAKRMEYLTGVAFFDADASAVDGPKADFRVDHPRSVPKTYDGFKAMARHPYFNPRARPARAR